MSRERSQGWRQAVVERGKQLLGAPYFWGGRFAYQGDPFASVDCSGLVSLLYRTEWIELPRDAHDQFLISAPREGAELQVGDLAF